MRSLKGFVSIPRLTNNQPGVINTLFELSSYSSTYSRDRELLVGLSQQDMLLTVFSCIDLIGNSKVQSTSSDVDIVSTVVKTLIDYGTGRMRPLVRNDMLSTVQNTLVNKVSSLDIGQLVDDGNYNMPEWVSFTSIDGTMTKYKVWLSDQAFRTQYDQFEILIVPPVPNIADLFGQWNVATSAIDSVSVTEFVTVMETHKTYCPSTTQLVLSFDLINKNDSSIKKSTMWGIVIYGIAGNTLDSIKEKMISYILSSSAGTQQEWEAILPDIFRRTEFTIIPRWDSVAVRNATIDGDIYSSWVDMKSTLQFVKRVYPDLSSDYVDSVARLMPFDFKAINLCFVAGQTNIASKSSIYDMFPDYIPVNTSSLDFGRMTPSTRDWVILIEKLVMEAEKMAIDSTLKYGVGRVVRKGLLYSTYMYDGVNYMVLAKSNGVYQS